MVLNMYIMSIRGGSGKTVLNLRITFIKGAHFIQEEPIYREVQEKLGQGSRTRYLGNGPWISRIAPDRCLEGSQLIPVQAIYHYSYHKVIC